MKSRDLPRGKRILFAGLTAVVLSLGLLEFPGHSRAAGPGTQPSSKVVVIPSFAPPTYPGYYGIPPFPTGAPQLSAYHFSQLAAKKVTAAALKSYDTVILYGIRWNDISPTAQADINAFAQTHKVVIWDADDTGPQNYATFVHPFSDYASGERTKQNTAVVTSFPGGVNFLASSKPSSPYYLDPQQLVTDNNELVDMNAMQKGTANWLPALIAANAKIPQGGWPLAWSYGVIGNHTGLTIYSGMDPDAFVTAAKDNPNNVLKELALQLKAPFRQTPDPACAPNCKLPGSSGGTTYATCKFAKHIPRHWVHGRVAIALQTSGSAGITGQIVTRRGRVLATGQGGTTGLIRLRVKTKQLPSNRIARLRARVLVDGQQACFKRFRLKVDNTPPRVLLLTTTRSAGGDLLRLRVSEISSMSVVGRNVPRRRPVLIAAHRTIHVYLPASVRFARLILRDRAGNAVVRRLVF